MPELLWVTVGDGFPVPLKFTNVLRKAEQKTNTTKIFKKGGNNMMNYFSNRKKWMAYLILLTFVFTCIVPTNIVGGNSEAWAETATYTEFGKSITLNKTAIAHHDKMTHPDGSMEDLSKEQHCNLYDVTLSLQGETLQSGNKVDIVMVLDNSLSMYKNGSGNMNGTKAAIKEFAAAVLTEENADTQDVRIGIAFYDSYAYVYNQTTKQYVNDSTESGNNIVKNDANLSGLTSENIFTTNPSGISTAISKLSQPSNGGLKGGTNTEAAFMMAQKMASKAREDADCLVIFMTDGVPTFHFNGNNVEKGPDTSWDGKSTASDEFNEALTAAQALKASGVTIYTIGIFNAITYDHPSDKYSDARVKEKELIIANNLLSTSPKSYTGSVAEKILLEMFNEKDKWNNATPYADSYTLITDEDSEKIKTAMLNSCSVAINKVIQARLAMGTVTDIIPKEFELTANGKAALESKGAKIEKTATGTKVTFENVPAEDTAWAVTYEVEYTPNNYGAAFTNEEAKYEFKFHNTVDPKQNTKTAMFPKPSVIVCAQAADDTINNTQIGKAITHNIRTNDGDTAVEEDGYKVGNLQFVFFEDGKQLTANKGVYTLKSGATFTVDANGNVIFTAAKLGTETFDYALKGKAEKGSTKKDVYVHKATVTVKVDNESIDVSGTKIWKDDNNQDGKRPVNIIVNLFADGTKVDSKTVTGSGDSWEFKFTDLPKYNAESQEIAYTVSEEDVEGYITQIEGTKITNTHIPSKVKLEGKKVWNDKDNQDGIRPASITVNLLADDQKVDSKIVTAENDWEYSFTNLDEYKNGQKIVYKVSEDEVKGYTAKIEGTKITNTHEPEKTEVTVKKVWDDKNNQDGKRPAELKVILVNTGEEVTLNKANGWTATIKNLPKYAAGNEIKYTWRENVMPEGYSLTDTSVDGTVTILTNSYTPEVTEATVKKVWDDADNQDGKRPESLVVTLSNGQTASLNADNDWTVTVDNLPKYAGGEEIEYTWTEGAMPEGYTLTDTSKEGTVTTLTNSYTPEKTEATVKKVWDDADNQDGKRPTELKVILSNGTEVTLNEGNGWTATITDLPKYANGQLIGYTWTEGKMPEGYELTDTSVNGAITTLTNSYIPETTEATVKKVWNDGNEQYGIRPDSLEVFLSNGQSVTLNAENNWTATIKELPKYAGGQEIAYTWREVSVPGYELTGSVTNGTVTTLTNTIVQSYFNIEGTKLWKDEAGNAIADTGVTSVEIQLFQNDEPYATATATTSNWTFEFKDVPRYNIDTVNGTVEKYEYRVAEVTTVAGYVPSYEVEKGEGNVINMTITNTRTYVEPGYMDITVEKQWNDNDNAQGKRPAEIEVTLYQNGNEYQTVKVTAEDNWMYSFEELPECNDEGKPYSYTVAEKEVEGYISLVVPTADGYKLINTLYTDQIGQFAVGKKVSAGTNAPAADTEYGFLLRIEALQENWNDVLDGQNKQLEKEKAIAEDNAEAAAAKVTEAEDAFRTSATAFTTGSAYRFIMAEKPVATSGSAYEYEYTIADWYGRIFTEVTTGSAYMWEGLGAAEDADSVIDAVIKAIKELAKELSSVFQRTVFMDALNSLMDAENSTPSALGFHTADADALLFAERNRIAADELVAEREQAMKDFRFDATTPSAITVVLTPNEDNSTREEVVFDLTPESKYYDAETKSYFVDFTLFQNTGYTVTIEATTGTMVKYVVSEVNGFEAGADADYTYDGTDVAVNGEKLADDSLVRNTGALDLVKGIANSITFTNKYSNKVVEEETTTPEEEKKTEEKKEETKKDDPEEIIPDEDVPKGSVEIPGEILEELDDPEIPLGDAPATGDTNNAVPFMALLLAAIVGLVITRRKFN